MLRLFLTIILLISNGLAIAFDHKHSIWDGLLKRHVVLIDGGVSSQVDYAGLQKQHKVLGSYLKGLSAVSKQEYGRWSKAEQLAFLINAYNAFTVELVLSGYPGIKSIKDLGSIFQSPWKKRFFTLLGEKRYLDDVEHQMIRRKGVFDEPRIHFAVNCASIGCPMLLKESYKAKTLDTQLDDVTRRFLSDRSRNHYDIKRGRLSVSKIFKWYREDFESGYKGYTSLHTFFKKYAGQVSGSSRDAQKLLATGDYQIKYLDYDWRLNDLKRY